MRVKLPVLFCASALAAAMPGLDVAAQEATAKPPQRLIVEHATIDPADQDEFEAWFKDWAAASKAAGLGPEFNWFTSSGPGFDYVWVSPFGSFADLDRSEERQKKMAEAFGEEKLASLMGRANLIQERRAEVVKLRPDMSYEGKDDADPEATFLNVGVHWVRPGMEEQYTALVKRVVEAYAKTEQPSGWAGYQVEFGQGTHVFVSTAKDAAAYYARTDTAEVLEKAFGKEESDKIFAEWRDCVSRFDENNARMRPELSYDAAAGGQ